MGRLGLATAHRASVGGFSGYSYTSGNFQNLPGQLKSRGLIDYPSGGLVTLTDAGRGIAQPSGTFRTLEDLHQDLRGHLGGPRLSGVPRHRSVAVRVPERCRQGGLLMQHPGGFATPGARQAKHLASG